MVALAGRRKDCCLWSEIRTLASFIARMDLGYKWTSLLSLTLLLNVSPELIESMWLSFLE